MYCAILIHQYRFWIQITLKLAKTPGIFEYLCFSTEFNSEISHNETCLSYRENNLQGRKRNQPLLRYTKRYETKVKRRSLN